MITLGGEGGVCVLGVGEIEGGFWDIGGVGGSKDRMKIVVIVLVPV